MAAYSILTIEVPKTPAPSPPSVDLPEPDPQPAAESTSAFPRRNPLELPPEHLMPLEQPPVEERDFGPAPPVALRLANVSPAKAAKPVVRSARYATITYWSGIAVGASLALVLVWTAPKPTLPATEVAPNWSPPVATTAPSASGTVETSAPSFSAPGFTPNPQPQRAEVYTASGPSPRWDGSSNHVRSSEARPLGIVTPVQP